MVFQSINLHTHLYELPCGSAGKESTCNVGDLDLIPGLGISPGEEKGYSLQYSDLENSKDCIDHGVTKSQTRLSDLHFHFVCSWLVCILYNPSKSFFFLLGRACSRRVGTFFISSPFARKTPNANAVTL